MCFSPKIKQPKVEVPQATAVQPTPISDEIAGIQFGEAGTSDDQTTEDSGIDSLTNKRDSDSSTELKTQNTTSSSDITASKIGKSIKRKSVFGGK
ncbi:DUF5476 domain-containing protein [Kluyvera intermedia]|uniref:DUF5476 domain-containing protein n=1 Tax=Kluyvera intermedia TaxID=61648 RepID=UPI001F2F4060|nr:DUF5476 domain-containing protein [Kluyvera intermedia]MCE9891413.1 DUF5476 domain-containing protein [Kluyvera intermedia]HDG1674899.1 DUF5476 domain-containing protein [Kluyvera cryocrescens]